MTWTSLVVGAAAGAPPAQNASFAGHYCWVHAIAIKSCAIYVYLKRPFRSKPKTIELTYFDMPGATRRMIQPRPWPSLLIVSRRNQHGHHS
jgi:hypothetical protein